MADELQEIVDRLGAELGCAVAVDDDRMELRAYSPHFGPVDAVRRDAILHRGGSPAVLAYINQFPFRQARHAVRIPASPELGMMPRIGVTLWRRDERLGYLWLVEPDPPLDDAQVARAEAAAAEMAVVLSEERWRTDVQRGRERELMRDLLAADPALRAHAAAELVHSDMVGTARGVQAIVVRLGGDNGELSELGRRQFDEALRGARRRVPTGAAVHLAHPDHGVLLLSGPVHADAGAEVCEQLLAGVAREGGTALVGVGTTRAVLSDARISYEQALTAIRVAQVVPTVGPVARWNELGVYRVLAQLPARELTGDALDPRLLALFAADRDGILTTTLETYLECGGDTRRTIDRLVLHRTSLYYRLDKIAAIAGIDPASGDDRLAMHLGLKIARLAGVHPSAGEGATQLDG